MRAVIHADLDAFFASVEVSRRPELKGRPVIVGADGDPSKRGVVSAASYEARTSGVSSGMPLKKAKKFCPEAVFLPVDFELYEDVSGRFMKIMSEYSTLVESFGLDEAFIEVQGEAGGTDPFDAAPGIASEIKERVKKELRVPVSVGVGPNKLLAKMATEMKKPDGFFVIRADEAERVLRDLPVRSLAGVGEKTEKRLSELGIKTIGELSKVPLQHLERNFGTERARALHEHSRGMDDSPVAPFHGPGSISREVTFQEDTTDTYLLKETLYELTGEICRRAKALGLKAEAVGIKVRYSNFRTITRSKTLDAPSDSMNEIWAAATRLFEGMDFPMPARLVGVKLSDLKGKE